MGIEETLKLIDIVENGGIQLFTVDFEKVGEELSDLDWTENKDLGLRILTLIMELIASTTLAKTPIVSFALPLATKIIKSLS
jgi:hypothetical protein